MAMFATGYQPIGGSPPSGRRRSRLIAAAVVLAGLLALLSLHLPSAKLPYAQHGRLRVDEGNPHANRWHPFGDASDECLQPAPALAASFLRAAWANVPPSTAPSVGTAWAAEAAGPDGRPWADVRWAQNRTVLYLGDSVARYKVAYLCQMAGEELIEINWAHPWSPPQIFKNGTTAGSAPGYAGADPYGWHKLPPGDAETHIGHYCYVPGLDFLLVTLHSYGLDAEGFYALRKTYIPPYTFEDRLARLAVPWIEAVRGSTARGDAAPELVYLHSALWDAMRWANEDMAGAPDDAPHDDSRLLWYRSRVRDMALATAAAFPRAALYWSTVHYPIRPSTGWFFPGVEPHKRPALKLLRLAEMQASAVSAFDTRDMPRGGERAGLDRVRINHWGTAVMGQEEHQVDDLHPTFLPSGYLWADMMLWDLRETVG